MRYSKVVGNVFVASRTEDGSTYSEGVLQDEESFNRFFKNIRSRFEKNWAVVEGKTQNGSWTMTCTHNAKGYVVVYTVQKVELLSYS